MVLTEYLPQRSSHNVLQEEQKLQLRMDTQLGNQFYIVFLSCFLCVLNVNTMEFGAVP
jgi:hypothetical protein